MSYVAEKGHCLSSFAANAAGSFIQAMSAVAPDCRQTASVLQKADELERFEWANGEATMALVLAVL
ncbi:MAG: hypothetical protein KDE32_10730 [Novosphingobium sp.]|nr:hypothetical protein [Novosphingobium sp.]